MGPHGAPQCPWGPPGRAESGPLATGMVMVKRVERLLRNYTLRWSHRSSTPHSLGAISTPYNNKSLGPFFEAVSVDAAAARLRRGLHRRPKAAHRRARWCSSQLPPCSRRLVPQPRRSDMLLLWKYTIANRPATHAAHSWASPAMEDGVCSATHHAQQRPRAEHPKQSSIRTCIRSEVQTCTVDLLLLEERVEEQNSTSLATVWQLEFGLKPDK